MRGERTILAFTLIELLVVVAVITILMTILMPSLRTAMGKARQIHCLSNHKQFGLIFGNYNTDSGGWWDFNGSNDTFGNALNAVNMWAPNLINNGYAKSGRDASYDIGIHCPALKYCGGDWTQWSRWMWMDYVYNAVSSFDGGGLLSTDTDKHGCKETQIPRPGDLCVLTDRWDKTIAGFSPYVFLKNYFPKYDRAENSRTANPFAHGGGSNYLFADGHAERINEGDLLWGKFQLRPNGAENQKLTQFY